MTFIVLKNSQCFCPKRQSRIWRLWVWFQSLLNSSSCLFCGMTCIYSSSEIWDAQTFISFILCFSRVWKTLNNVLFLFLSVLSLCNPYLILVFHIRSSAPNVARWDSFCNVSKQYLTVRTASSTYNYCLNLVLSSKHSARWSFWVWIFNELSIKSNKCLKIASGNQCLARNI